MICEEVTESGGQSHYLGQHNCQKEHTDKLIKLGGLKLLGVWRFFQSILKLRKEKETGDAHFLMQISSNY